MAAYFIVQKSIHDSDRYQKYLEGLLSIFDWQGGHLLTVSSNPVQVIESC